MKVRKIGLVGCGTIGEELAMAVDRAQVANAEISSLYDISAERCHSLAKSLHHRPIICENTAQFFETEFDLLVEAASQAAAKAFTLEALRKNRDVMLMSAGALAEGEFLKEVQRLTNSLGATVYIPTGAIAGLDAIRACRNLIKKATITTTKSPLALSGAPFFQSKKIDPKGILGKTELFSGTAAEAVKLFPANVNIAASVSLAGIGPEKTLVRIIADPGAATNTHEVYVEGSFGEIRITVNNVPSPKNPKTSYLAVLSAIECLRSICEKGLRVGS